VSVESPVYVPSCRPEEEAPDDEEPVGALDGVLLGVGWAGVLAPFPDVPASADPVDDVADPATASVVGTSAPVEVR
jgi:hypothetical protein